MKDVSVQQQLERLKIRRRALMVSAVLQPLMLVFIFYTFLGLDNFQNMNLIIGVGVFLVLVTFLRLAYYHFKYLKLKKMAV